MLAGSGCALTDVTIKPPAASAAKPQCTSSGPVITLVAPFEDHRQQRQRCGMKKNGYNMDTADVLCAQNPSVYLADLLAKRLVEAGYTVERKASAPSAGALHLQGQLLQFFVEPKVGAFTFTPEADIHVKLTATSASGLDAERDFYVKAEEVSAVGLDENFQSAADQATTQLVGNMAKAVEDLFKRYPDLKGQASGNATGAQPCS